MSGRSRARWRVLAIVIALASVALVPAAARAATSWPVSGRITFGGVPAPGVTVVVSGAGELETDADGEFSGTSTLDEGAIHVRANGTAVGFPIPHTDLWFTQVDFTAGPPFDIALPAPAAVTVRVREADGSPVEDVYVIADHELGDVVGPGDLGPSYSGTGDIRTGDQTDATGNVVLDELVGTTDLRVSHYGTPYRGVNLDDVAVVDGSVIDVVLPGSVAVSGHVTLAGAPISSAEVTIRSDAGSVQREYTDAAGAFSLTTASGPAALTVGASPQVGTASTRVEVTTEVEVSDAGGDQFDIDLPTPFVVPASVTDTSGAAVNDSGVDLSTTDLAAAAGVTAPGPVTAFTARSVRASGGDGTVELAAYAGVHDIVAYQDTGSMVSGIRFPQSERRATLSDQAVGPGDRFDLVLSALPGAPTEVVMDDSVRAQVTLGWSPPTDDVGTPITGYRAVVGDFRWGPVPSSPMYPPGVVEFGADQRSAVVHVASGHDTTVRLYALTAGGPGPAVTEVVHPPASLAGAPTNAWLEPGDQDGLVRIRWDPPAELPDIPITSYRLTFPGTDFDSTINFAGDARSGEFFPAWFWPASSVTLAAVTADGAGPGVTLSLPTDVNRVDVSGRRLPDGELVGDGEYGMRARQQLVSAQLARGATGRYEVVVGNDGFMTQRFRIKDPSNPARFRVRWFANGRDVTAAVRAGTYWTPRLRTGQVRRLVARVQVRAGTSVGTAQLVTLEARPEGQLSQRDRVRFSIRVT